MSFGSLPGWRRVGGIACTFSISASSSCGSPPKQQHCNSSPREFCMQSRTCVSSPILAAGGLSAQCRILFPPLGFPNQLVGRTPWSARDALVPPVPEESIGGDGREADQGVGRGRGRPPHNLCYCPETGKACGIRLSAGSLGSLQQAKSRLKGGCRQDCPPHDSGRNPDRGNYVALGNLARDTKARHIQFPAARFFPPNRKVGKFNFVTTAAPSLISKN